MKLEKEMNDAQFSGTVNTYYAGNYIYQKGNSHGQSDVALTFFNSEEGYIEPVFEQVTVNSSFGSYTTTRLTGFDYVYQYKDHLGNIRLAYQDMNGDGVISAETEIKEENHYYPFGLKHKGYNGTIIGLDNNFKEFQGQEFTEDLGLNIHEWKYRVSYPDIGRFWQIDPLAEDYVYNGTYNFAENRVIDGFELEGLEWVDTDGNEVYNSTRGEYTDHATDDHRRFGNTILKTPTGRRQFGRLINSNIPITTEISQGSGPSAGSRTSFVLGTTYLTRDGRTNRVKKAKIVIFEGRINDLMERISEYYEYDQEYKLDEQQQLFYENTTTNDEKVAAVVGHEIEHAVDEGNYDLHGSEREEVPEQIETSILREIPRTKRVNIASMPIYSESFTPSVTLMNEKQ